MNCYKAKNFFFKNIFLFQFTVKALLLKEINRVWKWPHYHLALLIEYTPTGTGFNVRRLITISEK